MATRWPKRSSRSVVLLGALLALLIHIPHGYWILLNTYLRADLPPQNDPITVQFLRVNELEEEEEEPTEDEEDDLDGQVVEIAPPKDETKPEEADFLAEYNSTVPEETVDPRYRVDREVIAETFSPDDAYELEDLVEMETDRPSTGAFAGGRTFKTGRYSLFPDKFSRYDFVNKEGLNDPAPSSHMSSRLSGSPSNDYMPLIASADRTALNAHEFLFASWLNRVKRMVSFYANQTLPNANPRVPIIGHKLSMVMSAMVSEDGELHAIDVDKGCGVPAFDKAIQEAFELAAPFPPPPEGMVEADGFAHIRQFEFVIFLTAARAELNGIDPRQNIQFPGLQTVPR